MNRNNLTLISIILIPVTFVALILVLWSLGFFKFDGTDASAKIVGTALTLGGGLVATMVTLIGLVLRQSIELRNADLKEESERRLSMESERNRALEREAEHRLKLEAAIQAVGLLDEDSNSLQRTGALFTLARLGMTSLAIDLMRFMLPTKSITPETGAIILDIALLSGDSVSETRAADFMRDHSEQLLSKNTLNWPDSLILFWPSNLGFLNKESIIEGLMKAVISLPRHKWDNGSLNLCVVNLYIAYREENDQRLVSEITLFLNTLLNIYPKGYRLHLPNENLDLDPVRDEIENKVSLASSISSDSKLMLIENLKSWMDEVPTN